MNNKNQSSLILVNKVCNFIIKKNLILTKNNILIAFSGGQDSFCLLFLMIQLMNQFQISVGFIYCSHLWYPDNIYKLVHLLKIGFIVHKPTFFTITSKKIFTEEKARIWRYSALNRISIFYNYKIIFTAHTLTDQIETLLLNLFRGSSKSGVTSLFLKQFIRNKFIKKIFISRKQLLLKLNK